MKDKPENFCMAPWTHTYLSPQTERRLCCASREPAQNFRQYIDTADGTNEYKPQTLNEWWNSDHVRRVRRQMMQGELPPECEVCDKKLLNTDVYRDYFWHLFRHKYDQVWETTDETGYTTMKPVSWDYRFSNLCNFKCRMCGPQLSSSWEVEALDRGQIEPWMEKPVRDTIRRYQQTVVMLEFTEAVEEHRVEEIYWVGGEPLMYPEHWYFMQRIIELGDGEKLYARYNTNLSRVEHRGVNLYRDLLANIRDWQICASLDGVGVVGEYIRTGLDYDRWLRNFQEGLEYSTNRRQIRIDFTLTTPGLFHVEEIDALASELGVDLLSKVTFAFTPDIAMSPLFMPRHILERVVQEKLAVVKHRTLVDTLEHLLTRPTFEEQWQDEYATAQGRAKRRIEYMDTSRSGVNWSDVCVDSEFREWWNAIDSSSTQ